METDTPSVPRIRVWDPLVRLFHWGLALSFAAAWLSADRSQSLHNGAGYLAGGLVVVRVVWGFVGTRYARFSHFVRPPAAVLAYLRAVLERSERRHLGHNPAGGAMIVVLLLAMASTALTGWLLTTDAFWGVAWMQSVHAYSADGLVLLVVFHLIGVAVASYRHRESLVGAMISGKKRALEVDDVG